MATSLAVVREPGRPGWRALEGERTVGSVDAWRRPDARTQVALDTARADAAGRLLAAVTAELGTPLVATVDEADEEGLRRHAAWGFEPTRRESHYRIPVASARARMGAGALPARHVLVPVDAVAEDAHRELDDALRDDVPGTAGWRWEREQFRDLTLGDASLDPDLYLVAAEEDGGRLVGLVRVWDNPECPRLGLIGVRRGSRGVGLARALLARVLDVLAGRGHTELVTEIDDGNRASQRLLLGPDARRTGGSVELVRPTAGERLHLRAAAAGVHHGRVPRSR